MALKSRNMALQGRNVYIRLPMTVDQRRQAPTLGGSALEVFR